MMTRDAGTGTHAAGKIGVFIVDDSAVVRQALAGFVEREPGMFLIGTAADPLIAERKMSARRPDVLVLDIEMPRMNGLDFLRKIMHEHPLPVIICSSFVLSGSENTIKALEAGAVAVIAKPHGGTREALEESRVRVCDEIRAAHASRRRHVSQPAHPAPVRVESRVHHTIPLPPIGATHGAVKVIAMGASTGGTEALREILIRLPSDCPGVVIVQHMPTGFTKAFSDRLNELCQVRVKEAEHLDPVHPGLALIAPGDKHMEVKRGAGGYVVDVHDGPLVRRHRPSVDVLLSSVARAAGCDAVGVLLTGMGDDGARGMVEMRTAGAPTIAQNEASCIVFGMPAEAIRLGGADHILPLTSIAAHLVGLSRRAAA